MTQRRLNHRMLLDIDKEMTDKLSLIEVGANEFCLVVMSVLGFSVTFAKINCLFKFVVFMLQ